MTRLALLSLAAALVGSCDFLSQTPIPPLPAVDLSRLGLPMSASGRLLVMQIANSSVELDPGASDPLTALGACADLVTYCYAPSEKRELETCVAEARVCETGEPWKEAQPCCPKACIAAFEQERKAGLSELEALDKVLFLVPTCFPGVQELVGVTP